MSKVLGYITTISFVCYTVAISLSESQTLHRNVIGARSVAIRDGISTDSSIKHAIQSTSEPPSRHHPSLPPFKLPQNSIHGAEPYVRVYGVEPPQLSAVRSTVHAETKWFGIHPSDPRPVCYSMDYGLLHISDALYLGGSSVAVINPTYPVTRGFGNVPVLSTHGLNIHAIYINTTTRCITSRSLPKTVLRVIAERGIERVLPSANLATAFPTVGHNAAHFMLEGLMWSVSGLVHSGLLRTHGGAGRPIAALPTLVDPLRAVAWSAAAERHGIRMPSLRNGTRTRATAPIESEAAARPPARWGARGDARDPAADAYVDDAWIDRVTAESARSRSGPMGERPAAPGLDDASADGQTRWAGTQPHNAERAAHVEPLEPSVLWAIPFMHSDTAREPLRERWWVTANDGHHDDAHAPWAEGPASASPASGTSDGATATSDAAAGRRGTVQPRLHIGASGGDSGDWREDAGASMSAGAEMSDVSSGFSGGGGGLAHSSPRLALYTRSAAAFQVAPRPGPPGAPVRRGCCAARPDLVQVVPRHLGMRAAAVASATGQRTAGNLDDVDDDAAAHARLMALPTTSGRRIFGRYSDAPRTLVGDIDIAPGTVTIPFHTLPEMYPSFQEHWIAHSSYFDTSSPFGSARPTTNRPPHARDGAAPSSASAARGTRPGRRAQRNASSASGGPPVGSAVGTTALDRSDHVSGSAAVDGWPSCGHGCHWRPPPLTASGRPPVISSPNPSFRRRTPPVCGTPRVGDMSAAQMAAIALSRRVETIAGAGLAADGVWERGGLRVCEPMRGTPQDSMTADHDTRGVAVKGVRGMHVHRSIRQAPPLRPASSCDTRDKEWDDDPPPSAHGAHGGARAPRRRPRRMDRIPATVGLLPEDDGDLLPLTLIQNVVIAGPSKPARKQGSFMCYYTADALSEPDTYPPLSDYIDPPTDSDPAADGEGAGGAPPRPPRATYHPVAIPSGETFAVPEVHYLRNPAQVAPGAPSAPSVVGAAGGAAAHEPPPPPLRLSVDIARGRAAATAAESAAGFLSSLARPFHAMIAHQLAWPPAHAPTATRPAFAEQSRRAANAAGAADRTGPPPTVPPTDYFIGPVRILRRSMEFQPGNPPEAVTVSLTAALGALGMVILPRIPPRPVPVPFLLFPSDYAPSVGMARPSPRDLVGLADVAARMLLPRITYGAPRIHRFGVPHYLHEFESPDGLWRWLSVRVCARRPTDPTGLWNVFTRSKPPNDRCWARRGMLGLDSLISAASTASERGILPPMVFGDIGFLPLRDAALAVHVSDVVYYPLGAMDALVMFVTRGTLRVTPARPIERIHNWMGHSGIHHYQYARRLLHVIVGTPNSHAASYTSNFTIPSWYFIKTLQRIRSGAVSPELLALRGSGATARRMNALRVHNPDTCPQALSAAHATTFPVFLPTQPINGSIFGFANFTITSASTVAIQTADLHNLHPVVASCDTLLDEFAREEADLWPPSGDFSSSPHWFDDE